MGHLRVRIFENRILRRIFAHKRDKNGRGRKLYNEEYNSLYLSVNIARVIEPRI